MSRYGRAQDALCDLFDYEMGDGTVVDGPVKRAGITRQQWAQVMDDVLEAVAPIFTAPPRGGAS